MSEGFSASTDGEDVVFGLVGPFVVGKRLGLAIDVSLWGNMVVASVMPTPRTLWMSVARESTDSMPPD